MPEVTPKKRVTTLPNPAKAEAQPLVDRITDNRAHVEGEAMPAFLQREIDKGDATNVPPSLDPLDNPAMKAVFNAHNQYERAWLKGVVDDAAWEIISRGKDTGFEIEDDLNSLDGLTGIELQRQIDVIARRAFHNFIETCHARRVQFKNNPELVQAHAAEWQTFKILSRLAGWVLDFGGE